ncbi:26037_t:CDS:2, partial [Racocetra persica]
LGTCFLCGGISVMLKNEGQLEQEFSATAAQASSSLMTLACITLILPAAFSFTVNEEREKDPENGSREAKLDPAKQSADNKSGNSESEEQGNEIVETTDNGEQKNKNKESENKKEESEEKHISSIASLILLIAATVITAFSAEFLVGSIEGIVKSLGISETFIGLILLPIVGNAAEHVTSVTVAMNNKMDLAIGVAVGSST